MTVFILGLFKFGARFLEMILLKANPLFDQRSFAKRFGLLRGPRCLFLFARLFPFDAFSLQRFFVLTS